VSDRFARSTQHHKYTWWNQMYNCIHRTAYFTDVKVEYIPHSDTANYQHYQATYNQSDIRTSFDIWKTHQHLLHYPVQQLRWSHT